MSAFSQLSVSQYSNPSSGLSGTTSCMPHCWKSDSSAACSGTATYRPSPDGDTASTDRSGLASTASSKVATASSNASRSAATAGSSAGTPSDSASSASSSIMATIDGPWATPTTGAMASMFSSVVPAPGSMPV